MIATAKKTAPHPVPGSTADFSLIRSVKIKARLMGRINNRWVYSSECNARAKVLRRGCHPRMRETAKRNAKRRNGDFAAIALSDRRDKDIVKPRLQDIPAEMPYRKCAID